MTSYGLIVAPLLVAMAAAFLGLGTILLRNSYPAGAPSLGLAMFTVSVWLVGGAGELVASGSPLMFLLFRDLKYVGVCLTPPLFFLFIVRFAGGKVLRPWMVAALFAVPVASILMVWSNPLHQLMWPHPPAPPGLGERAPWGPWFNRVHLPVLWGMMAVPVGILVVELVRGATLRRAQAAVLLVGVAPPLAVNVIYVLSPAIPDLQPTPIAFAFTAVVYGWGFFRFRLFQVNPLALRAAFDAVGDSVLLIDLDDRVADANPVARRLLRADDRGEVLGLPLREALARAGFPAGAEARWPTTVVTDAGRVLECEARTIDEGGRVRGTVLVARDVTERHRAEEALRVNEAMMRAVVERAPIGILRLRPLADEAGRVRDFSCVLSNPTADAHLASEGQTLSGRSLADLRAEHTPLFLDVLRRVVRSREAEELVVEVAGPGGEPAWFRVHAVPVGGDVSVTFVDISEERARTVEMAEVANRDALTGLLSRRGLEEDAARLLASARDDGRRVGVLFLDLDRFKDVNDTLGHNAGDEVLRTFARRLQKCVRAEDLVARMGGDEFVVLTQQGDEGRVREMAERIREAGGRPYAIEGREVHVSVTVGIALMPDAGEELELLVRAADEEMYRMKPPR